MTFLRNLTLLLLALTGALSLAGYAADVPIDALQGGLDLTSHFRPQYAIVALVLLGVCLALKDRWLVVAACVVVLANLVPVAPYLIPSTTPQNPEIKNISILHLNVLTSNTNTQAVRQLIKARGADIISLQELNHRWVEALEPVLEAYPYRQVIPRPDNFGIGLYSQIPLSDIQTHFYGQARVPSIYVKSEDGSFDLLATHPLPPVANFRLRNQHLQAIADNRHKMGETLIIVGDLNVSPWSVFFQRFAQETGLRDSQLGRGIQPTWPTSLPLFAIPIDHVLVSPNIQVQQRETGLDVGSDHLPVFIQLSIPGKASPTAP